jgi:prepilin peptidase CpaA
VIAVGMIIVRGRFGENLVNVQEILGDLAKAKGITEVAEKAAQRKSRLHLLPYGIPLCLGFIGYLLILEQMTKGP